MIIIILILITKMGKQKRRKGEVGSSKSNRVVWSQTGAVLLVA
jgi:hypothetical protein